MAAHATNGNGNGFAARYGAIIQTVMVVALFGAAFWTGVMGPLVEAQRAAGREISVSQVAHEGLRVRVDKLEAAIVRIDERHEAHVVPRREHDANKATLDSTINTMQARINEIRQNTTQQVTVGDELKQLRADLLQMRQMLYEKRTPPL